jgi:hypothetical protein
MTQTTRKWIFNPVRGTLALPPDCDVSEIDWEPVTMDAEPTADELARVRSGIVAHLTGV